MSRFLVYTIYNLLLPIGLLLGFPSFIIKGIRRGGLARNFWQRLGFFDAKTKVELKKEGNLWMHAVSVGEVFIALKIIRAIHEIDPARPIILSTTTATGFRVAEENIGPNEEVTIIHNPVDLPWVAWSVLQRIQPEELILVEAEIWPNLVAFAKRKDIPVFLANARLSPKSESLYQKFLPLIKPIFSQIDQASVPFINDVERWSALGISKEKITVVGGVKFDEAQNSAPPAEQIEELASWLQDCGVERGTPVFLAGCTHDGEETLSVRVWRELRKEFPDLALVIVPRHAERGNEIAEQLTEIEVDLTLLREGPNRVSSSTQQGTVGGEAVCVANTTGELRAWYHLADVVMIGKSFTKKGGQNPVEPVLAGKPTVVGPNMQNFADVIRDLVAAKGISQVQDETALQEKLAEFLRDPAKGKEQAEKGCEAMLRHRGAARKTAELILS